MLKVEVFDWSLLASSNLYFNKVNTTFPQSFNCFVKFMYEYLKPFHGLVEYYIIYITYNSETLKVFICEKGESSIFRTNLHRERQRFSNDAVD